MGVSLLRPVGKGSIKLGKGLWKMRGTGAVAQIGRAEAVEAVGYVYGKEFLTHSPTYVRGMGAVLMTGYAYDFFESLASSAQSYQQHGGARGTPVYASYGSLPPGTAVHKAGWNPDTSDFFKKRGKHHCKKGYTLAKVGGAMMCIKLPRTSKNS